MKKFLLLVLPLATLGVPAVAEDATAIMNKVYEQSQKIATLQFDVEMIITDSGNKERKRYFTTWKKKSGDLSQVLMKFFRPADLKGTALLNKSRDQDTATKQQIYFPALRRIVTISSEQKSKSFMGSDFTNEDMGGRTLSMDTHTVESRAGDTVVVRQVPIDKASHYTYMLTEVDTTNDTIRSIEFFDKKGALKKLANNKIDLIADKMYLPTASSMANYRSQGKTELTVSKIKSEHKN